MNKIRIFLLAAIVVVAASNVNAQGQKSGYISVEQMVSLMPELGKIDTLLQKFQSDSLNTEFQALIQDYQYRDSMLTKTDTTKMPASVKAEHRRQMEGAAYQIQNWQQISQNVMQSKQQELLAPIYQRIYTAINQVAKDNGYTYVYKEEALIVAPPADNLLPLVARKLNIKLPTQDNGAAGNRPTANKPNTTKKSQ
ncbi:MAG TPA: OmpH family outer membrane protein [Flavisolibacter sp.]